MSIALLFASTFTSLVFSPCLRGENPLLDYLGANDSSKKWEKLRGSSLENHWKLTSQTWHGTVWTHDLTIHFPKNIRAKGTAVLIITGDRVGLRDEVLAQRVATMSGLPVATLYQVPNQPLFGQKEDALIAVTMQKWFETGDSSWPLLFPMAKSASSAMDAISGITRGSLNPIRKFVVVGASKRGWTTWLVAGAKDARVVGFAPIVFNNLGFFQQMQHQKVVWGNYSPQIRDYEKSGMLATLETPKGRQLARMMDPITYVPNIRAPLYSINGTNDPYWVPDAMKLYWKELHQPKSALFLPNTGHTFNENPTYVSSLAAFAASCSGQFEWPRIKTALELGKGGRASLIFEVASSRPVRVRGKAYVGTRVFDAPGSGIWNLANTSEFRPLSKGISRFRISLQIRFEASTALLTAGEFQLDGNAFTLTGQPTILQSK